MEPMSVHLASWSVGLRQQASEAVMAIANRHVHNVRKLMIARTIACASGKVRFELPHGGLLLMAVGYTEGYWEGIYTQGSRPHRIELQIDEAQRPENDQDTAGVFRSSVMAEAIFEKIRAARVIVADVTLTGQNPSGLLVR